MGREHKEPTISFRPSAWERAIIEQRAAYLFDKKKESGQKNWKDEVEIEQYRQLLRQILNGGNIKIQ